MAEMDGYPLSELESRLKSCLAQRPDISSHILSVQELADYTAWMAETYGGSIGTSARERLIGGIKADTKGPMMALGRRILSNPSNPEALRGLVSRWGDQQEGSFINPYQDISAWQMIRYMPAHWHSNDYFEIYYAFSGECPVHFANEVVTVRPGTVLIVAPGVMHASPCYGDDKVLVYYNVRSSTFDRVFWNQLPSDNLMSGFFRQALSGKQPNSYLHFETDGDTQVEELMWKVFTEYQEDAPYSAKLMNAYMSACLILLMRSYMGSVRLPRTENFYWRHQYSAILTYIQMNYAVVRLETLAEMFHYSEKQIRRIVREHTGMSYSELIAKLKMERAASLIGQHGASIEDAAYAVGYSTVSSFYRSFRSYFGCTPAEYRDASNDRTAGA